MCSMLFFFNDTATTEIYTLSLHDALPISAGIKPLWADITNRDDLARLPGPFDSVVNCVSSTQGGVGEYRQVYRSEEHTSELQSRLHLVCRLLLEKKKDITGTRGTRVESTR